MLKKICVLVIIIPFYVFAQQESIIKNVDSKAGNIVILQNSNDSAQKSFIDSIKGDSIKINVIQINKDIISKKSKLDTFKEWISSTTNLIKLILLVIALTGIIWKGIQRLKKYNRQK